MSKKFTRVVYDTVVRILAAAYTGDEENNRTVDAIVDDFDAAFTEDNPRFESGRFRAAIDNKRHGGVKILPE